MFTTHTPVPAGIDRFSRELMEKYFANWCRDCGLSLDDLMALGHEPGTPEGEVFNMATLSLRLAGTSNGVSALHGDVSRRMFAGIWPDVPVDEVPISSVTNGVHARTWTSPEMSALLRARCSAPTGPRPRPRTGASSRRSPTATCGRPGGPAASGWWPTPGAACTRPSSGGARASRRWRGPTRCSTPRRSPSASPAASPPTSGPRCCSATSTGCGRCCSTSERPVQLIFAGKAHPADDQGKELLQQVATMAADLDLRDRLVLLEDYDITVARMLVAGVDVWLNTPLRPLEACGTSGMKAVFNGVLNCSVLDGWWDEMYDGDVGWAIPSAEWEDDLEARNDLEAASLFNLLERQVVPLFYARTDGLPGRLAAQGQGLDEPARARGSGASRMLREYTTELYEPAAQREPGRCGPTTTSGSRPWCAGAATSTGAGRRWRSPAPPTRSSTEPGHTTYRVAAQVSLGDLDPSDVEVQLRLRADRPRRRAARPADRGHGRGRRRRAPRLAPLHPRARLRPGRQLRLHRAHRAVPPRPAQLRLPRQGGLGPCH